MFKTYTNKLMINYKMTTSSKDNTSDEKSQVTGIKRVIIPNEFLLPDIERLLREGHSVTLRTRGSSMYPFIVGIRDSVILRYTSNPQVGDIALAHLSNNKFVLHRIIKLEKTPDGNTSVTLMGDGNIKGTERCMIQDICGIAVTVIRNNRHYNPNSRTWTILASVWKHLLPVRRWLLAVYRRCIPNYEKIAAK